MSAWIVNVGGRAYGPYTDAQMAAFAAEGRLTPISLVARPGENACRAAGQEPLLAPLFAPLPPARPARKAEPTAEQAPEKDATPVFGRNRDDGPKIGEKANMLIVADMKSRSINGLEEEIFRLGQAYPLLPQIWLLRTDQSVNTVRNLLVQQLGKLDVLFVVDATNDKAAWFNFAPEAETRIRRVWARKTETAAKPRATD